MKKLVTLLTVAAALLFSACDCNKETQMKMEELMEKQALKELVDTFSNLADMRDTKTQSTLFTEDATMTSIVGGNASTLKGRDEIEKACAKFLSLFDTVYHSNGQQVVTVDGDRAKGVSYCTVMLIGKNAEGVRTQNLQGVRYEDEYQKIDGKWYIAKRTSHFEWSDVRPTGN